MVLMASEKAVKQFNLQPMARYITSSAVGVDPRYMGIGPVYAIRRILANTGMTIEDIGLVEINEAFAMVTMAAIDAFNLDQSKVNVNGGACALGHPLGSSGSRIIVTLLHALKRTGGKKGVAALCIGGGEATAIAVELLG